MRAQQQAELTGPAGLVLTDLPLPEPSPTQVLIRVAAAGVSFPDLLLSRGEYQIRMPAGFVPGVEVSGTVISAPESSGLNEGDRVAAFTGIGGWAEYAVAEAANTVLLPDALSLVAAGGMVMNYGTAHFALVRRGRLVKGDTVLVHGAAGGVGTAAVQIAGGLGCRVLAVVSTAAKAEVVRAAGADEVLVGPGWLPEVRELTGGRGVDVVVDPVGSGVIEDSLRALAPLGRHLVIGFAGGDIPQVRANRLLLRNIDLVGVAWGAFTAVEPDLLARQWEQLLPLVENGSVRPDRARHLAAVGGHAGSGGPRRPHRHRQDHVDDLGGVSGPGPFRPPSSDATAQQ